MDYSKDYQSQTQHNPLGNEPVLLTKISVNTREDGVSVLILQPEQGQGIELAMDQVLLHSICKLLRDTVSTTDWDIELGRGLLASELQGMPDSRAIN